MIIPAALMARLTDLVKRRYTQDDENSAGWRGAFVEVDAPDGSTALIASNALQPEEDMFLIDHLWCTTYYGARAHLLSMLLVRRNMVSLLGLGEEEDSDSEAREDEGSDIGAAAEAGSGMEAAPDDAVETEDEAEALLVRLGLQDAVAHVSISELDLDSLPARGIHGVEKLKLPETFPQLEALSLQGLGIKAGDAEVLSRLLDRLPDLRALWLNDNPIVRDEAAMEVVLRPVRARGRLEILNRGLTEAYGAWALRYLSEGEGATRLDLKARGLVCLKAEAFEGLPDLEWLDVRDNDLDWTGAVLPELRVLRKLKSLWIDLDGGNGITLPHQLACELPTLRWLNGRAIWRSADGAVQLAEKGSCAMEIADKVLAHMWRLAEPMRIAASGSHHPELYWYVMDSPGLAVSHSEEPNMAMLSVHEKQLGITFTVFWPIRPIAPGDRITRDFVSDVTDVYTRATLLDRLFGVRPPVEVPQPIDIGSVYMLQPMEPAGECVEEEPIHLEPNIGLKIFTDMPVLQENLKQPCITFTSDAAAADILWTTSSVPRVRSDQWLSRHPGMESLDDKSLMAKLLGATEKGGPSPTWLPLTFCLPEDLPRLLHYWGDQGEETGAWIVKPPHLARGWDIVVTSSLGCILRYLGACGRLTVSKYVEDPDTFQGRKYDLRLYVLMLSPHRIMVHDHFRVRLASEPYRPFDWEDVRIHLTNTTLGAEGDIQPGNGTPGAACTVSMDDFISAFPASHGGREWGTVRRQIDAMLAECFRKAARGVACSRVGGERLGIRADPRARTLLGVDVLLTRTMEPKLIEMNVSPNCIGVCKELPSFFDNVFAETFDLRSQICPTGFRRLC